jgi:hypothetical protein
MDSGLLYIVYNEWIRDPETRKMPYKIGITKYSVSDRYYGLGLKMPGKFETLFAYKLDNYTEAEKAIGTIFNKNNINGEWYYLDEDDIALIEANCKKMHGKLVTDEIIKEIRNETEMENIVDVNSPPISETNKNGLLSGLKVGGIAKKYLRDTLENGKASDEEISLLQNAEYSNKCFHINYPLLVRENTEFDNVRYYKDALNIKGVKYYLCSQWYERSSNNDRPFLIKWLEDHYVKII